MLAIRYLNVSSHESDGLLESRYLTLLSRAELDHSTSRGSRANSQRFLIGRILLRILAADCTGCAAQDIILTETKEGRLIISHPEMAPSINLSHSGDIIICAASSLPVGIDIEQNRHRPNILNIAEYCFSEQETSFLRSLPSPLCAASFYELWTLKEAYIKNTGAGISGMSTELCFDIKDRGAIRSAFSKAYQFFSFIPVAGYTCSVALKADALKARLIDPIFEEAVSLASYRRRELHPERATPDLQKVLPAVKENKRT